VKDPMVKVARQRMSSLQLTKALSNASEACRQSGMDRMSFYEWKRRFQTQEIEALKDLSPIHSASANKISRNGGKNTEG